MLNMMVHEILHFSFRASVVRHTLRYEYLANGLFSSTVARTCSLILIVLDVLKPLQHKKIIEKEVEGFGIRFVLSDFAEFKLSSLPATSNFALKNVPTFSVLALYKLPSWNRPRTKHLQC